MKLTAKVKILPTQEQHEALKRTLETCNDACNFMSDYCFENRVFGKRGIQKKLYYEVKSKFGISAQVVLLCIAKVAANYRRDKTVKHEFRKHGSIAFDDRILSYSMDKRTVSIWTVEGRQKGIEFVGGELQYKMLEFRQGESDLVFKKNKFYLCAVCDIPNADEDEFEDALGLDLGMVNIATLNTGKTYTSEKVEQNRKYYDNRRAVLQSVGTKSAKRRLKKISGKEHRFKTDVNHCISKEVVSDAKAASLAIAMEDLKGIRKNYEKKAKRRGKEQKKRGSKWAFDQLRTFITYKAGLAGVHVIMIDPRNTSRTCSKCGYCDKQNRKSQSEFICISCGHAENADVNAAKNIRIVGLMSSNLMVSDVDAGLVPLWSSGTSHIALASGN